MSQDQQPQPWWRINPLVGTLAALALIGLLITVILGYLLNWEWTGLVGIPEHSETKLGWDWLELLIIPVLLAVGAFWFNAQARKSEQELAHRERKNDRLIAEDRVREEALQRYLDRMQALILEKGLRKSEKDAEIRDVARARTLTVLRSLDGNRKGKVTRFLHEADLIGKSGVEQMIEAIRGGTDSPQQITEAIIDLREADLSSADLSAASLSGAILLGVNLRGAALSHADLWHATLSSANLRNANLSSANLSYANLSGAFLLSANLSYANLSGAYLSGPSYTDLRTANFRGPTLSYYVDLKAANVRAPSLGYANPSGPGHSYATLTLADLSGADLSGAKEWCYEQLAQAKSLVGAILPDGTVMTEETWEEFKQRYRH